MRNYNFKLYNFIMNIFVISNKRIFNKIHIQSELFDFDFLYRKKKKKNINILIIFWNCILESYLIV